MIKVLSIAFFILCGSAFAGSAGLYRWVDEHGVTHYGDRVPVQYSKVDREVVNPHGDVLAELPAERSADEILADKLAAEEAQKRAEEEAQQKVLDNRLLQSYTSLADIESVRDRRIQELDSQMLVIRNTLINLKAKWEGLEKDSELYAPINTNEKARPLPKSIKVRLRSTKQLIAKSINTLNSIKQEKIDIREHFDTDIKRYTELAKLMDKDKKQDQALQNALDTEINLAQNKNIVFDDLSLDTLDQFVELEPPEELEVVELIETQESTAESNETP